MASEIKICRRGRVVLITLNRPDRMNALSESMAEAIMDVLAAADADPSVGCVVITGNERAFAAGAEIKGRSGDGEGARNPLGLWHRITAFKTPKIAVVQGFALGGGCELAMMCDYILAGVSAKFGQPEVKLGVIAGMGGTQRLTRLVGRAKSMRAHLTARTIGATEAEACGLVAQVLPDDILLESALEEAALIASFDKSVTQLARDAVHAADEMALSEGLAEEDRAFVSTLGKPAHQEGVAAFRAKRPPKFNSPDS